MLLKQLYNFKVAFFIVLVTLVIFPVIVGNFTMNDFISSTRYNRYLESLEAQSNQYANGMYGVIEDVISKQNTAVMLIDNTYFNNSDIEEILGENNYFISWEITDGSSGRVSKENLQTVYIEYGDLVFETAIMSNGVFSRKLISKYEIDMLIDYMENNLNATATGASIIHDNKVVYSSKSVENFNHESVIFSPESMYISEQIGRKVAAIKKSIGQSKVIFYYDITAFSGQLIELNNKFNILNLLGILIMVYLAHIYSKSVLDPYSRIELGINNILSGKGYGLLDETKDIEYQEAIKQYNNIVQSVIHDNKTLKEISLDIQEKNSKIIEINEKMEKVKNDIEADNNTEQFFYERNQGLLNQIDDLFWIMDLKGNIEFINTVASKKFGYDVSDLIGSNISDLVSDSDNFDDSKSLLDAFFKENMRNINLWFNIDSGRSKEIFSVSTLRIYQDDMFIGVQGIGRSIIDEVSLKNKIYKKNREMEFLNEINSSLISNIHLNDLLKNIVDKVGELYDTVMVTVQLIEDEKLLLKAHNVKPGYETYLVDDGITIKDSLFEELLNDHEIRVQDFVPLNKNFDNQNYSESEYDLQIAFIPLVYENKVKGLLSILLDYELTDNDLSILNAFSIQGTIVIERSRLFNQLKQNFINTIKVLASSMDAKDSYTQGHSSRVSTIAVELGHQLNLSATLIDKIEIAGLLHDIGKIGILDRILTKTGKLTDDEFTEIKNHPLYAKDILEPIGLENDIIDGIYYHHVRYDLKGYPSDHQLEKLSIIPAIIGVADAFDAMTSNRSYQKQKTIDESLEELYKYSGSQFDPSVVKAMQQVDKKELERIVNEGTSTERN